MTAAEFTETIVEADDAGFRVLDAMSHGGPWVFLAAKNRGDDGLAIEAQAGGGITSTGMVRNMLRKALDALPAEVDLDLDAVDVAVTATGMLYCLSCTPPSPSCTNDHHQGARS